MDLFSSTAEGTERIEKERGLEAVGVCVLKRGRNKRNIHMHSFVRGDVVER